jgi:hypothetical protein
MQASKTDGATLGNAIYVTMIARAIMAFLLSVLGSLARLEQEGE